MSHFLVTCPALAVASYPQASDDRGVRAGDGENLYIKKISREKLLEAPLP